MPSTPTLAPSLSSSGFTIILISILLTIAALIFVSVLPGQDAGDFNQKTLTSSTKLERVEEAMRTFMAANGRRPCPADGQYQENTANFGIEAANPGTCTSGTPAAPLGPDAGTGYVVGGTIPTKTLGLDDSYAYDEFGRRFTYVVDVRATDSLASAHSNYTPAHVPGCYNLMQSIKVSGSIPDITIESTTGGTVIDHTMYAYISHGASGYGAWPAQGSSSTLTPAQSAAMRINSGSTDTDMQTNAGVNSSFTYSTSNFTNVKVKKDRCPPNVSSSNCTSDTGFDDLVLYRPDLKDTCCIGPICRQVGFRADGKAANDLTGTSVAIGDVNGDGIPDLIIGAPGVNSSAGAVYVVFGTRTGFPDPLPLSSLNGTNGAEFVGATSDDTVGSAVAVGDVNGDGYGDIIIGASGAQIGSYYDAGSVYVVFGKASSWPSSPQTLNSTFLNGTNGVEYDGAAIDDYVGTSVAAADVNGDGYADILIGAPGTTISSNADAGSVYVVFGKASSWPTSATTLKSTFLNGTNGSEYDGAAANDGVGYSLAAGDVNGDGYADLIIGAPSFTGGSGGSGGGGNQFDDNTPGGNVNSFASLLVAEANASSNSGAGSVYVVFGKSAGWPSSATLLNSTLLNGSGGVEYDGATSNINAGVSVAAGDVNGDGYADIVIGTPGTTINSNASAGSVYVVFGQAGGWPSSAQAINSTFLNGTNGVEYDGAAASDYAGFAVAAGDGNGDGLKDIVINAPGGNGGTGAVYVVFGQRSGWPASATLLNSTLLNAIGGLEIDYPTNSNLGTAWIHDNDWFSIINDAWACNMLLCACNPSSCGGGGGGSSETVGVMGSPVLAIGDLNGDGVADLAIGDPVTTSSSNSDAGSVYVVFGYKGTTALTTDYSLSGL